MLCANSFLAACVPAFVESLPVVLTHRITYGWELLADPGLLDRWKSPV